MVDVMVDVMVDFSRLWSGIVRRSWGLVTVLASDDSGLGPSAQDPAAVHQTACKVLDVPCTTDASTSSAVSPGSGGANVGGPLTLFFYLVLLAVLIGIIYLIVRAVRGRGEADETRETVEEVQQTPTIIDRSTEPDQWRARAAEMVAAGRYREALRCRYRALVGDLARRGLLDEIPGRTTGEERAEFSANGSPAQQQFNEATDLFDEVWYGDEPAGIDEHDRFVECEREVLAATAGRPRR